MADQEALKQMRRIRPLSIRLKPNWSRLKMLGGIGGSLLLLGVLSFFFEGNTVFGPDFKVFGIMYGLLFGGILSLVGVISSLNRITVTSSGIKGSTLEHKINFGWWQIRDIRVSPDGGLVTFQTNNRVFRIPLSEMDQKESEWFLNTIRPLLDDSSFSNPETAIESENYF